MREKCPPERGQVWFNDFLTFCLGDYCKRRLAGLPRFVFAAFPRRLRPWSFAPLLPLKLTA